MLVPKFSLQQMDGSCTTLSITTTDLSTFYNVITIVFLLFMGHCCGNMMSWNRDTKIFKQFSLRQCEKNVIRWRKLSSILMLCLEVFSICSWSENFKWLAIWKPALASFRAEASGKWPRIFCILSGVAKFNVYWLQLFLKNFRFVCWLWCFWAIWYDSCKHS